MCKKGDIVRRKAQSGSGAATLVGIILVLFIFYILFLPPEERKSLLDEGTISQPGEEAVGSKLLDVAPGRLTFTEKTVIDHSIPNIYLESAQESVILAQENPFTIYKGLFGEQTKRVVFSIDNLNNLKGAVLGFSAPYRKGILIITLNGMPVFENAVPVQNVPPVVLPRSLLRETNELEFSVQGSWIQRKKFELSDVKVVGELTDAARQRAESSFTISPTEYDNLESAFLDFFPICDQSQVGLMTGSLNGKLLFAASPACDSLNRQDVFKEDLVEGKNTISFQIDRGSYRIEQVRLRTTLKPVQSYIQYFDVKQSLYNDVLDNKRKVILKLEFVNDGQSKRADVSVNGKLMSLDQKTNVFERDVSAAVREGNNYLEIRPLSEMNIVRVEARVE
jgi:hypothetical protein